MEVFVNVTQIMSNLAAQVPYPELARNPIVIGVVAVAAAAAFAGPIVYRKFKGNKEDQVPKLFKLLNEHDALCKKVESNFAKQEDKNELLRINYEISNETLTSLETIFKGDVQKIVKFVTMQDPRFPHYRTLLAYPRFYAEFRNRATGVELQKYFTAGTPEAKHRELQIKFCERMNPYREEFKQLDGRYDRWTIRDLDQTKRAAQDSMPT